ncbi:CHASE2 domain-containing protein [Desulfurobacterium sp.]
MNKFGRWPWSRHIIARGLEKLKMAKVVALDMVFSESTVPSSDAELADTIDRLGNVVCGFFMRGSATENPSNEVIDVLSDSAFLRVPGKLNIPMYRYAEVNIEPVTESCLLSGTLNVEPDEDGIIRHYPLLSIFKGDVYPALGLQVLRLYFGKDFRVTTRYIYAVGKKLPIDEVLLNFYSLKDYYSRTFSFADLYDGKIPVSKLKGKIVVLGVSEAGVTDIKPSPIAYIPGPMFHFTFISNFLNNDFVFPNTNYDLIFMLIGGVFVIIIFYTIGNIYYRVLTYVILLAILSLLGVIFYVSRIYFPNIFLVLLFIMLFVASKEVFFIAKKSREARLIKSMFDTYVSPSLLNILIQHPEKLKLGGEKREISVLFADIRGFTTISENLEPEKLVELLNTILTPLTDIILKNSGTLDKYIGDAIMAIWNAPLNVDGHVEKAILSGWEMVKKLEELNKTLKKKNFPSVKIGVGINTGEAIVGNMGSNQRFDYTAIGDTVNLASRIEGLNKIYGTTILASENSVGKVNFSSLPFFSLEIDSVAVKGKEKPVRIYTFLEKSENAEKIRYIYEKGVSLYRERMFEEALSVFSSLKNFQPAVEMSRRCKILLQNPPENWNGVFHITTK